MKNSIQSNRSCTSPTVMPSTTQPRLRNGDEAKPGPKPQGPQIAQIQGSLRQGWQARASSLVLSHRECTPPSCLPVLGQSCGAAGLLSPNTYR